jgi:hypothetical protein
MRTVLAHRRRRAIDRDQRRGRSCCGTDRGHTPELADRSAFQDAVASSGGGTRCCLALIRPVSTSRSARALALRSARFCLGLVTTSLCHAQNIEVETIGGVGQWRTRRTSQLT